MATTLSWGANAALFVLGCFLAADTANALLASALTPPPEAVVVASAAAPRGGRSWSDRQVILTRNLFNSSTLAPAGPPPEEIEDDLQPTRLPLTLLGTAAAEDPSLAWAAIEDRERRTTLVVNVGADVKGKATVQRIERRRVVLLENGSPRELSLDSDDDQASQGRARVASRRPSPRAAQRRSPRVQKLGEDRFSVPKSDVEETLRNPSNLFSQARILPKYTDGAMVGVQVNAIKSGSIFEEIGFENGDVIKELNGITIDSPEQSAKLLQEFTEAESFSVIVQGANGEERTLDVELPE